MPTLNAQWDPVSEKREQFISKMVNHFEEKWIIEGSSTAGWKTNNYIWPRIFRGFEKKITTFIIIRAATVAILKFATSFSTLDRERLTGSGVIPNDFISGRKIRFSNRE